MSYAERWRAAIAAVDPAVAAAARARVDALTKPRGSLGRLEDLAVRLCAIAGGIPDHPSSGAPCWSPRATTASRRTA